MHYSGTEDELRLAFLIRQKKKVTLLPIVANNQRSNQVEFNTATNGCEEPTEQLGRLAKQQDTFVLA